jgi:hypothetical protein
MSIPAFVSKDIDLMRFIKRIEKRTARYSNWRQIYYDCNGMCQYPVNSDYVCGEMDGLEYHEMYEGDIVIKIALLCNYHHNSVHNGIVNPRHYKSMLQTDIDIEVKLAGGVDNWKNKYNIVEREIKYDFQSDYRENKSDLQYQES